MTLIIYYFNCPVTPYIKDAKVCTFFSKGFFLKYVVIILVLSGM